MIVESDFIRPPRGKTSEFVRQNDQLVQSHLLGRDAKRYSHQMCEIDDWNIKIPIKTGVDLLLVRFEV